MVYLTRTFWRCSKISNVILNKNPVLHKPNFVSQIAKITSREPGDKTIIRGWIKNIRKMKTELFVDINDGSCHENLQIVAPKSENMDIGIGQSIEAIGVIQKSRQMKYELRVDSKLKIIGECNLHDNYPFTPKQKHNPEYVREHLHMRSRVDYMNSLFRIRHHACKIINDFMDENDFIQIHTPILTSNDCEGAGEVFLVRPDNEKLLKHMAKSTNMNLSECYFDRKTFLSVSGQLHLEAMTHGLGNTYTFSPVFRAENSKSNLHLSEFYMFEAELAFIYQLEELTDFIEKLIKCVTERILNKCSLDLKKCSSETSNLFWWLTKKWFVMSYDEAYEILFNNQSKLKTKLNKNEGFSKEQEFFLVDYCKSPLFIIEWPKSIKPFYMKESINDPTKVYAVDLLMPSVGELVGGSLRENNLQKLNQSIPNDLNWYLDLRKFGNIPTGGFGLGFDRYLQLITNITNIRDVIPFPRYPHNCST